MDAKDVAALRKIGKEMLMPSDKLLARYEAETQLEMFRDVVGIRKRKGLDGQRMAAE